MGELINISGQILDTQIPQAIARDAETAAAIASHVAASDHLQYLPREPLYGTPPTNPDGFSTGLKANDSNIDGIIKGWHFITSLRGSDSGWGIQLAICDTQSNIKYRRKTFGTWQAWVTIV